jgi:hypothetical protein
MTAVIDDPPNVPPPVALGAVTANAVVMGAAGAAAPMAWLLVPALMGVMSRPRTASVVSLWGLMLIGASVIAPLIPGHDPDPWALGTSCVCLTILPGMAWVRIRGHARKVAYARRTTPAVIQIAAEDGARRAALARAGTPAEVAEAVQVPDGAVRVLLGVVAGDVPEPVTLRDRLERKFRELAVDTSLSSPQLMAVLAELVRRSAPDGYVAAALVEIDRKGAAQVLSCGSPQPLAARAEGATGYGRRMGGSGSDGPPLGLDGAAGRPKGLPDDCRIAVITNAYVLAHYDDYSSAAADSLCDGSLELAAVRLMQGVARPSQIVPGLESAPVVGPALVIGPRQHRR